MATEKAIVPLKDPYGRRIGYAEVHGSEILCHISEELVGKAIMDAIKVGMTSGLSISPQLDSAVPATFNTNKEKTNAEGE